MDPVYDPLLIDCAAIRLDDGQIFSVPKPGRHHTVIAKIRAAGVTLPVGGDDRQGFLLNDGKFVNRKDALHIALAAGQVQYEKCHAPWVGLFSEDVW
jgi:hypothetical protein